MTTDIFEAASRAKLRFDTPKGFLSAEDLWDLPLTSTVGKANLDDVARSVNRQLKATADESFVSRTAGADKTLQLKLDVVKRVIEVRMAENESAAAAVANREKRNKVLDIIESKKAAALENLSVEELEKMAKALA